MLAGIVAASTTIALFSGEADKQPNPMDERATRQSESIHLAGACPELRAAAAQLAGDDYEGFVAAIEHAGSDAEEALQRDGVVFGRPERLALELSFLVNSADKSSSDARIQRLLSAGVDACSSTGPG